MQQYRDYQQKHQQITQDEDPNLPPPIYTGTIYPPDEGSSAPFMDRNLLKRPARKQVSSMTYFEDHPSDGQDYNIWYHKRPGYRRDKFEDRENPGTKCNVLTDAGKTKAAKAAPFCVYFAAGRCALGGDCTFHHRVPTYEDEARIDLTHDVFGRERFSTDREDMGGVGNFSRENRTLYIGCVKITSNTEDIVKKMFEEWGPIEYVRVIHTKSIAFVRYFLRATAEFAKEAMNNQSLEHNEVLNVRWATEDSNPTARLYEERRTHRTATTALNKRLKLMDPTDHNTMYYDVTGEYPDTEPQFDPTTDASQHQYEYTYPQSDYNEPHPYSVMNTARAGQQYNHETHPYAAYNMLYGYENSGYVPTYFTAEKELARQEEEEERMLATLTAASGGIDNSGGTTAENNDTTTDDNSSNGKHNNTKIEETKTYNPNPYYNDQPLQFSSKRQEY